ncbi:TetR family transcriptional regulator [Salinirubellus salinus]|jgi:AcrR family transcriptional regulator|uniref:TetR family transcriptional regulator n=1 Tax=Salinirubellus salinus TaxID=1364945 RepID=A0A9E7R5G5_9EURY|nr:TetR/AcrR family transcriptional regulator [Salinirubellus salinus]UWM56255.1 TetR family transcriptional regulator [Salinirubellus salinus]
MSESDAPERGETTDRIMRATYCALCRHGYADLTMQDIADESDLSKAALHYHYESKAALLESFLEFLLDSFRERVDAVESDGPRERLGALVELLFEPPGGDADAEFRTAMLELKAQAPYAPALRERLAEFDAYLRGELTTTLERAAETGLLRAEVSPETAAEFVVTVSSGAHTRRVALDRETTAAESALRDYVDDLFVEEAAA